MTATYRKLLVKISSNLSGEDLANLLFCCEDDIPESKAEKVSSGVDLFKILKHLDLLSPDNYEYLREQLQAVGRIDLASLLPSPLQTALCRVPSNELSVLLAESCDSKSASQRKCDGKSKSDPLDSAVEKLKSLSVTPRAQIMHVCDSLTEDNVSKLSFLFADRLSKSRKLEEIKSPLDLLTSLEKAEVISMECPASLAEPLEEVGRKDLASFLRSHISVLSLPSFLTSSHQMLGLKLAMLKLKQSVYSMQRKILQAIASCDSVSLSKHLVSPVVMNLVKQYDYSIACKLAEETQATVHQSGDLTSSLCSTLSNVYSYYELYFESCFHALDAKGINLDSLALNFKVCHEHYNQFEAGVADMSWNVELLRDVRSEFTERRTPIGTPALKAVGCIYEVCKELYGGSELTKTMEMVDKNLYTLESLHYSYCCRIVVSQWVETVILLLDKASVTLSVMQCALIDILRTYKDFINSTYKSLTCIFGGAGFERLKGRLSSYGIELCDKDPQHLSGKFNSKYIMTMSVSSSTYLILLVYMTFFGTGSLDLRGIFTRLKQHAYEFMTTDDLYVTCAKTIFGNVISSFEGQVDGFREKALEANPLCSPAVDLIIRTS